jgi:hypothetical protein
LKDIHTIFKNKHRKIPLKDKVQCPHSVRTNCIDYLFI